MTGKQKYFSFVLIAALVLLVSPLAARADNLTILVSNGATTFTCADGAGCDSNPLAGAVQFTGVFGVISAGGTGFGAPNLPIPSMDLSYNLSGGTATAATTFTVAISQNNLAGGPTINFTGSIGGTQSAGETTTAQAWAGANNNLFVFNAGNVCGPVSTSASPVSLTCSGSVTAPANPFSETLRVQIAVPAGGSTLASGDFSLTGAAVPEPSSLLLLGTGLLGIGATVRRRKK